MQILKLSRFPVLKFILVMGLFFVIYPMLIQADGDNRVQYTYAENAQINEQVLILEESTLWRIMDRGIEEFEGPAAIVLNHDATSGIAYANGESFLVSLIDGTPEKSSGFKLIHLYTDHDQRILHLSDGTARRVTDPEISLEFQSGKITEFILTDNRQHLIRLDNGERLLVSPPVR